MRYAVKVVIIWFLYCEDLMSHLKKFSSTKKHSTLMRYFLSYFLIVCLCRKTSEWHACNLLFWFESQKSTFSRFILPLWAVRRIGTGIGRYWLWKNQSEPETSVPADRSFRRTGRLSSRLLSAMYIDRHPYPAGKCLKPKQYKL